MCRSLPHLQVLGLWYDDPPWPETAFAQWDSHFGLSRVCLNALRSLLMGGHLWSSCTTPLSVLNLEYGFQLSFANLFSCCSTILQLTRIRLALIKRKRWYIRSRSVCGFGCYRTTCRTFRQNLTRHFQRVVFVREFKLAIGVDPTELFIVVCLGP